MEQLWAPWRMEFIQGAKSTECIFCTKPAETERSRENLILARGHHSFVILNRYPYNNGHLMVVPLEHVKDLEGLEAAAAAEIHSFLQRTTHALNSACHPEGFNVGLNLGKAAGAGIEGHLHYHVVPRWNGDTNFLPVLGLTKSIPEHLLETYDLLKPYF